MLKTRSVQVYTAFRFFKRGARPRRVGQAESYKKGQSMLGASRIMAFVPTADPVKARAFYEGKLGLRFLSEDHFALVFDADGIILRVTTVPEFKPTSFTI